MHDWFPMESGMTQPLLVDLPIILEFHYNTICISRAVQFSHCSSSTYAFLKVQVLVISPYAQATILYLPKTQIV